MFKSFYNKNEGKPFLDPTLDHLKDDWRNIVSLQEQHANFQTKVDNYKIKIQNNQYPYCIIFSHKYDDNNFPPKIFFSMENSAKIQAYSDLSVSPRIIEISKINSQDNFDIFNNTEYLYNQLYEWHSKSLFTWLTTTDFFLDQIINSNHPFSKYIKNGFVVEKWFNGNIKSKGRYVNHKPDGIIERFNLNEKISSKELYENGKFLRPIVEYFQSGRIYIEYILNHNDNSSKMITYTEDGNIEAEEFYNNGKYGETEMLDGPSSLVYHMNGKLSSKQYFKNGKCIRFQEFDDKGRLMEDVEYSA